MARLIDCPEFEKWVGKERLVRNPNCSLSEIREKAYVIYVLKDKKGYAKSYRNYCDISESPHITIETILAEPDYNWNWQELSKHLNITMDIIEKHQELPWDPEQIIFNPNLTAKYTDKLLKHFQNSENYCKIYCKYKCNQPENCSSYTRLLLNILNNKNLSIFYLMKFSLKYNIDGKIAYHVIYKNKSMTLSLFKACVKSVNPLSGQEPIWAPGIDKGLSRNILRVNRKNDIERKNIYFQYFSSNPNLTFEYVMENKNENWDWRILAKNPSITIRNILDHPELQLASYNITFNENVLPEDLISQGKIYHNDWLYISSSPKVSLEYILENRTLPWNWAEVSSNPNLTLDIVRQNPDIKWDFINISNNLMTYHPYVYKTKINLHISQTNMIIQNLRQVIISYGA